MIPKKYRIIAAASVALIALVLVALFYSNNSARDLTQTEFDHLLEKNLITEATLTPTIYDGIFTIAGTRSLNGKTSPFQITTHLTEEKTRAVLEQGNTKINTPGQSGKGQWLNLFVIVVVASLVLGLVYHQTNMGRGRVAHKISKRPSVRFSEVAGIEEAKSEVTEIIDFLRNPSKYRSLGSTLPKGVLLIGPPGTGKTMLAKAIASEADAHFFSAHGSDFNEVFVGVGAKRIRELFRQASRHKPAIIFIDEIDCLGKNRKFDTNGETQQTNNALLAAMDGFESSQGIVVIAATNRPEDLDEALTRPGRFDRKIIVPLPDITGRRAILKTHAQNKPICDERALDIMAQTTPGMSGADLANLLNEAAILAAQQNQTTINLSDLEYARDKVRFGQERKSMVVKTTERETIAYHEAGHTIVGLHKTLLAPLYKVSIVPRGNALGVTTLLPTEDQHLHSKDLLLEQLVVLMGGRAAERLFFGGTTNGANGDLDTAKKIARRMIHDWGMGSRLYYEPQQKDAELEINRMLEEADAEALEILTAQKANTEKLALALLARETLTRQDVIELLAEPAVVKAA